MNQIRKLSVKALLAATVALTAAVPLSSAQAREHKLTVLYNFANGNDGGSPQAPLIMDDVGNLYGTTAYGGSSGEGCGGGGCGTVFKIAPDGTITVLYSFTGAADGGQSVAGLVRDADGNLYGTTYYGGTDCGCGTVFKVTPDGKESVLHAFTGGDDGSGPDAGLIRDANGNFYGTTSSGGNGCGGSGCGTVFRISRKGKETIIHAFSAGLDGAYPNGLIGDADGNLYGTTGAGGGSKCQNESNGCGTVFKIAPDGTESVLHAFARDGREGSLPNADLIMDGKGRLYGTTWLGGGKRCGIKFGCGVVFKVATDGTLTVLHKFGRSEKGYSPYRSRLLLDKDGNLYGTTYHGGFPDLGTVFKLGPDRTEKILHRFTNDDGWAPWAGLIQDANGNLYGTTTQGGAYGGGTVFKVKN